MAYKYTTGSTNIGDIGYVDDSGLNTKIDFEENEITFITNGKTILSAGDGTVGIGTSSPISTFEISGSQGSNFATTDTGMTLDGTHHTVAYDGGSNATIVLPAPTSLTGRIYQVINLGQAHNSTVTVTGSGGGQFTGCNLESDQDAVQMEGPSQSMSFISTGQAWFIFVDNRSQEEENP